MASLAELLDYQARKKQVLDALNNASTGIENVSYGLGEGFADQVRGIGQLAQHPIQSVQDVYQGVKQAVQNPRQALEGVKQYAQEAVSSPTAFAKAVGQNVNPMELANALKKAGAMRELTVYHGTPHRLPPTEANPLGEFDASKIGTGEGAQAYGHGIYMAESPDVAGEYKKMHQTSSPSQQTFLKLRDKSIPGSDEWKHYDLLSKEGLGNLYTIDLPDETIDKMLDWDKPLSKQSKAVQNAIRDYSDLSGHKFDSSMTGSQLYNEFGKIASKGKDYSFAEYNKVPPLASEQMRWAGIPGIRYLDSGSRGAGEGTSNFVVFPGEEKKAKIIKRE